MKTFKKFLPVRSRVFWLALGLCFCLSAVTLTWFHGRAQAPSSETLSDPAREMRDAPGKWGRTEHSVSDLTTDIRHNDIAMIGLTSTAILVTTVDGRKYFVADRHATIATSLLNETLKNGDANPIKVLWVSDGGVGAEGTSAWLLALDIFQTLVGLLVPLAAIAGVVVYMRKQSRGARLLLDTPTVSFKDVIGAHGAKTALSDVTAYLQNPKSFALLGIRPPCGVLLTGSPGVGKTMLAKALAGETGANFISITGSYFSAKYFGAGVKRAQNLFALARANTPCIIWIDEADGIGTRTNGSEGSSESESNRVINQVLAELDGFEKNEGIIVIAATNYPERMDEAMLRPGRFDRQIHVALPDVKERQSLFEYYARRLARVGNGIDFAQLSRMTTGMSPASIAFIANHAGLLARSGNAAEVAHSHFAEAIQVARMGQSTGAEQALAGAERSRIARHEAGHAIVGAVLGMGLVEHVTIMPRGASLGATYLSKEFDKRLYTERELKCEIMLLLGGRQAEVMAFGEASTGAAQDLEYASRLALDAVTRHGFGKDATLFSVAALPASHAVASLENSIEKATSMLDECNDEVRRLLIDHAEALSALEAELLFNETASGERVRELLVIHKTAMRAVA